MKARRGGAGRPSRLGGRAISGRAGTLTPVEPTSSASGGRSLRTVTSTASSRGSTMSSALASRPAMASSRR